MENKTEKELFEEIKNIVKKAGELILPAVHARPVREKEGSANYVTKYDSMVQQFLIQKLSELAPGSSFLGEEDGLSSGNLSENGTFIIDPIDGTTNFICDFKESAICVGYFLHGHMETGVVYNPFRDELFSGWRGHGAFLNDVPLRIEDLPLEQGVLCVDTAPYTPELRARTFERIQKLSYHCMDIRDLGSAALSICYVACSRSAAYLSPKLSPWDYAAASVILSEAGGILTDLEQKAPGFGPCTSLCAATRRSHADIFEILAMPDPSQS